LQLFFIQIKGLFPVLHSDCPFYAVAYHPFPVDIDHILIHLLTYMLLFISHLAMLAIKNNLSYALILISLSLLHIFYIIWISRVYIWICYILL